MLPLAALLVLIFLENSEEVQAENIRGKAGNIFCIKTKSRSKCGRSRCRLDHLGVNTQSGQVEGHNAATHCRQVTVEAEKTLMT